MIPRNCLQCGGPLPRGSGPNERWCGPADFRAWYLARHPDYQPVNMKRKRRKLVSALTGAMAELDYG